MRFCFVFVFLLISTLPAFARLGNTVSENKRQFGKELLTKEYIGTGKSFCGKKIYQFPLYGWQLEAIYRDGKSFSETVRPKGNKVSKEMISEQEANVISDALYSRRTRGGYRKQIKNAHFISHFFEHGVISYEMRLSKIRKKHVGVIGVRAILYSNGDTFKKIKVNAYH